MIYLNNRLVAENNALISVFDHGFLYGDGIYETLRVYRGVVFKVDEHIDRLFRSASMIGLTIHRTPDAIKRAIYKTIRANRHSEAYIRISISRGPGPIGIDPELCPKPTFVIISKPFKEYQEQYYQKGVKIAIVNTRRNFNKALDPKIKSLNFLNNILAKMEAKDRGAYEAVMLNYRGYIAEGTITNVFFVNPVRKRGHDFSSNRVEDNILCTPGLDVGILDGITRMIILDIARELGIEINEGRFRREDIYYAQEVFISNTTMEVMPVAEVDDIKTGTKAGRITRLIRKAYRKKVAEYLATNVHKYSQIKRKFF